MKSLIHLLGRILEDSSIWCSTSTTRDRQTIARRAEHEGISFLMITLPAFCQDFERSLTLGRVTPGLFVGFRKRGALPVFLRGLLELVFDASDGVLLDAPDSRAVYFIRQICLLCKKIELPCSDARVSKAWKRYIQTNNETEEWEELHDSRLPILDSDGFPPPGPIYQDPHHGDPVEFAHFLEVSILLWNERIFPPHIVDAEALIPKHGPGATAERISANGKYTIKTWHNRLEHHFPVDMFGIPNWNFVESLDEVEFIDPEHERPVRVIQVPKTLKTPRIIAIEPVCMQYTQQALLEMVVPILENHWLYNGALGFTDQTVNQKLALRASSDGSLATIDLQDASDRVSARLIALMLAKAPHFRDALFACRSLRADVPEHGIVPLFRFASMGSAMCFPVEAMLFYSIVLSAITRSKGHRLSLGLLHEVSKDVRVYGDDIIVPVEYVQCVRDELEFFNLRVNVHKSFGTGKFRESCGLDAYDGIGVTPVYQRQMLPTSHRNTKELLSAISLRNQLYKAGCWRAAESLDNMITELRVPLPVVAETSPIQGRHSFLGYREGTRWDCKLHHMTVKGLIVKSRPRQSIADGLGALMKYFLKRGDKPFHDKEHLRYSGRPTSVYTKMSWALPY